MSIQLIWFVGNLKDSHSFLCFSHCLSFVVPILSCLKAEWSKSHYISELHNLLKLRAMSWHSDSLFQRNPGPWDQMIQE